MESKLKLLGHPVHPMLIVFPLGLLSTAVIFDLLYLATGNGDLAIFAFWAIAAGVVGGLAAAVFGFGDWLAIPGGTRAKRVGLVHGLGNVLVLLLFIGSWLLRRDLPEQPETAALVLSFAGAGISLITAWLGGELVDRLSVGVDDGAHLNAPSSLTHKKV